VLAAVNRVREAQDRAAQNTSVKPASEVEIGDGKLPVDFDNVPPRTKIKQTEGAGSVKNIDMKQTPQMQP
jgi:hypothetical protein